MIKYIENIKKKNNIDEEFIQTESGFTNKVYLSENYIIKIIDDIESYKKEKYIYINLKSKFISELIDFGIVDDNNYLLIRRNNGVELFSVWDKISDKERHNIIAEISNILKTINNLDNYPYKENFYNRIRQDFDKRINELSKISHIDEKLIIDVKEFFYKNIEIFENDLYRLVYVDLHFDNFLYYNGNITTIFDFEHINYAPLDYQLDIWVRLSKYPWLYANERIEKQVDVKNYREIVKILKEEYQELFESNDIIKRLQIYSLLYDINLLTRFPKDKTLINRIYEDISEEFIINF